MGSLFILLCLVMLAVVAYTACIFITDPAFIKNPFARYFNPELHFAKKYLTNKNRENKIHVCKTILEKGNYGAREKKLAAIELYHTYSSGISLQQLDIMFWVSPIRGRSINFYNPRQLAAKKSPRTFATKRPN